MTRHAARQAERSNVHQLRIPKRRRGNDDQMFDADERRGTHEQRYVRDVAPKTENQARFIEAIRDNDVTLVLGPAGSGKTYLAVVEAVRAFDARECDRIVLTRPAVSPGAMEEFEPGSSPRL
jgi:phosphate starvation-inducible PhoH-like protein